MIQLSFRMLSSGPSTPSPGPLEKHPKMYCFGPPHRDPYMNKGGQRRILEYKPQACNDCWYHGRSYDDERSADEGWDSSGQTPVRVRDFYYYYYYYYYSFFWGGGGALAHLKITKNKL